MKKQITIGSLYAGVEGIGLGFEQAGAKVLWANENNKDACTTIRTNFNHEVLECGIETLTPKSLERIKIYMVLFCL